jgi:hypothetical protein
MEARLEADSPGATATCYCSLPQRCHLRVIENKTIKHFHKRLVIETVQNIVRAQCGYNAHFVDDRLVRTWLHHD